MAVQPRTGVCAPWATVVDLCSPCDDYDTNSTLVEESLQAASDVLYVLSGRQFPGVCTDSVVIEPSTIHDYYPHDPAIHGFGPMGRGAPREMSLGVAPIRSVTSVTLDGDTVETALYEVRDWSRLVRKDNADGSNPGWAFTDEMTVGFTFGREPPTLGVQAAAALGCQLYLACQPETTGECRLPQRVQSITRQGVSMVMLDPFDFLSDGKTGVYEADLFLAAYNSGGIRRPAAVMSPDFPPRTQRITWP